MRTFILPLLRLLFAASTALAQSSLGPTYRLGVLTLSERSVERTRAVALPELAKLGFVEGQNLVVDIRVGGPEGQAALARSLFAAGPPSAILAIGTEALRAAHSATGTVPIVTFGTDAVEAGLAASLARPGGNVTGFTILGGQLDGKRLELLHEAVPTAKRVGALRRSSAPQGEASLRAMNAVAAGAGIELLVFDANGPNDYRTIFAAMRAGGIQALAITSHPALFRDSDALTALSIEARLPTVCQWAEMAQAGCLISYGPSLTELYRLAAEYVARIFRGTPPGELPIEQPSKFEITLNLKTARVIGVDFPPALLARADEVIE
jgi:ABC-type uncharacterized transport system substrate-binding protein